MAIGHHSHDVQIFWNFWPLSYAFPDWLRFMLNIFLWPLTLPTWWTWSIWNLFTVVPDLITQALFWYFLAFILIASLWISSPVWAPIIGIVGGAVILIAIFSTSPLWLPVIMVVLGLNFLFAVAELWR